MSKQLTGAPPFPFWTIALQLIYFRMQNSSQRVGVSILYSSLLLEKKSNGSFFLISCLDQRALFFILAVRMHGHTEASLCLLCSFTFLFTPSFRLFAPLVLFVRTQTHTHTHTGGNTHHFSTLSMPMYLPFLSPGAHLHRLLTWGNLCNLKHFYHPQNSCLRAHFCICMCGMTRTGAIYLREWRGYFFSSQFFVRSRLALRSCRTNLGALSKIQ